MHLVSCRKCATLLFIHIFFNWINGSAKRIKKKQRVRAIVRSIFRFNRSQVKLRILEIVLRFCSHFLALFKENSLSSSYKCILYWMYDHCFIGHRDAKSESELVFRFSLPFSVCEMNKWNRMWNCSCIAYSMDGSAIVRTDFYCVEFVVRKSQHAFHYLFIYVFIHSFLLTSNAFDSPWKWILR